MKMVKSLLLGSATALVAMTGAQAADLPVKAKPVQYVKICSLYGLGYFYIPGTDTCIKLGGAVRMQYEVGAGGGGVPHGFGNTVGRNTRVDDAPTNFRNRIYFSFDTRQQTEYGTLRTYARFGIQQTTPADGAGGAVFWDRAMIQFAGFTVGKTVSYFDAITFADLQYSNPRTWADSGAIGSTVVAYTAQFGNGVSATLSLEDPNVRGRQFIDVAGGGLVVGGGPVAADTGFTGAASGMRYPDIVGNIRVDQAWGSAQIQGAIHDMSPSYFGANTDIGSIANTGSHTGWAVGGGFNINLPGWGAVGIANSQPNVSQFRLTANYCDGAVGYCNINTGGFALFDGRVGSFAFAADGVMSGVGPDGMAQLQRTSAWNIAAAYQHIWTPTLRTSLWGGYLKYEFNDVAAASLCPAAAGGAAYAGALTATGAGFVCDPDFSVWQVGSRTQWNPVSQLDLGIDVLYSRLETGNSGPATIATAGGLNAGPVQIRDDSGQWSVMARAQRNFWP